MFSDNYFTKVYFASRHFPRRSLLPPVAQGVRVMNVEHILARTTPFDSVLARVIEVDHQLARTVNFEHIA